MADQPSILESALGFWRQIAMKVWRISAPLAHLIKSLLHFTWVTQPRDSFSCVVPLIRYFMDLTYSSGFISHLGTEYCLGMGTGNGNTLITPETRFLHSFLSFDFGRRNTWNGWCLLCRPLLWVSGCVSHSIPALCSLGSNSTPNSSIYITMVSTTYIGRKSLFLKHFYNWISIPRGRYLHMQIIKL